MNEVVIHPVPIVAKLIILMFENLCCCLKIDVGVGIGSDGDGDVGTK